jgi:hypothetical protein
MCRVAFYKCVQSQQRPLRCGTLIDSPPQVFFV